VDITTTFIPSAGDAPYLAAAAAPSRTVLVDCDATESWLTGTKLGCGEGGCGACTVDTLQSCPCLNNLCCPAPIPLHCAATESWLTGTKLGCGEGGCGACTVVTLQSCSCLNNLCCPAPIPLHCAAIESWLTGTKLGCGEGGCGACTVVTLQNCSCLNNLCCPVPSFCTALQQRVGSQAPSWAAARAAVARAL
jgi:aerobic-type carbon monoxide dehydrogenase small subunit (CoxS/CutS family)